MKRLGFLIFCIGLFATNSYAIVAGEYRCMRSGGAPDVIVNLYSNGTARVDGYPRRYSGYWNNYGEKAIVIKKSWIFVSSSKPSDETISASFRSMYCLYRK